MRHLLAATVSMLMMAFSAHAETRPYADYEPVKYVAVSAGFEFQSKIAKVSVLSQMPAGITVLVYASSDQQWNDFLTRTLSSNLRGIVRLPMTSAAAGFWARSTFPRVIYRDSRPMLVDFGKAATSDPTSALTDFFHVASFVPRVAQDPFNLVANRLGDCIVVDDGGKDDSALKTEIGCGRVIRLPATASLRRAYFGMQFVSDGVIVTDQPEWMAPLTLAGFEAHLLPVAQMNLGWASWLGESRASYINTLILNRVAFVPTFGLPSDVAVLNIFASLGLAVTPINLSAADAMAGDLRAMITTFPELRTP